MNTYRIVIEHGGESKIHKRQLPSKLTNSEVLKALGAKVGSKVKSIRKI